MSTTVSAGNMLNKIIVSDAPLVARVAVWIAYYPLMRALAVTLDQFERTISSRYEPIEIKKPLDGWTRAVRIE